MLSVAPSSLRERLRRWLRLPRTLKVTRTGRTFLVVTVGVGLGALNTGNNMLYLVLGMLLSITVASGILSERCLRGLTVRRLGAEAAFAGEPFAFRWALTKTDARPAFALEVSEADGPLHGSGHIAFLPPGAEHVVRADLTAPRRGPVQLTGVRVTTTFPLGLFAKTRIFELEDTLLVFPARGFACHQPTEALFGPVGEAGNPRRTDGTGDVLGLRELREDEDVRRVHWKKSASVGKLLKVEREREERRAYQLTVEDGLPFDALERRCEEIAALTHRLLQEGHEVGLTAGGQRLRPAAGNGQERRILCSLAWLGYATPAQEEAA